MEKRGYAIGSKGLWSRGNDNFITVAFDNSIEIDVLWKGLNIIDKEYLEEQEKLKNEERILLKEATNIVMVYGPLGGFKYLSFDYPGGSKGIGFKETAEYYENIFVEYGLPIKCVREKSQKQLQEEKDLKSATNIVLLRGIRGGYKQLDYQYISNGKIITKSIKDKVGIDKKLEIFKELKLDIKENILKK